MSFVHLHVHSEYSLLDGFSNIKKLIARAKAMNMPAIALTDHGTMFGVIDFYNAAKAADIKPIIGVESYLAARGMNSRDPQLDKKSTHILLIAENQVGYSNLLQVASAAQLDGFYYYPRIDHDLLASHSEGLICTSGCMSAEVPRLIQNGDYAGARKLLDWYYEVFGRENFFLELQQHDIPELDQINKMLIDLGQRYDARFVATNDVHYVNQEDARLQDILLAIQTGCLLADPNRMRMTDNSYYLRSPQEMASLFSTVPDAVNNTLLIAERCNVDLGFKGYHLPQFSVPEGYTAETYLSELCEAGLRKRYGDRANLPVYRERLEYELSIIHKMGFDAYFLIVWDLCRYARAEEIWYNARGSAAGSMTAYTLEITMVDPIEHKLIFERFLNPGRISMPDIDLDFRDDLRYKMLEYTGRKYGDDKVAQIITFGTMGARAAIRDVGRVMDIPLTEVDKVAKLIPNIPGKPVTIETALEEITEFKQLYQSTSYLKDLIDTAAQMEGVVRNAGTHAAGVIIADKPIIEYLPLHRPTGSSVEDSPVKTVSQFEMNVLDSLGMLKVDFLGLATLTIMARACGLIRQRHGVDLDLNNIPIDDPATYELLGRGDTAGVFQVEGSGMRRYLMQMKPKELANVIAMVALFRPGPMDFIPGYIRRMHGEEEVAYRHPDLEPIFKETFGYPVYQEQLMFAVMELAGYTPSEADDLRKAISKKMKEKLEKHREKFISGAEKKGIARETAAEIFGDWEEFARYGFNKAHAADYGVLSVQTAYLKAHYPVEYMTALLSVTKDDTGKVALYVADSRRMGIPVEPPEVNASVWDFTIEDRPKDGKKEAVIRFGMGAVKNVGQGAVEEILRARGESGFDDLNDFARRTDLRKVGKRALECLIKVGALDSFGPRVALLDALDRIVAVSSSHFRAAEAGQMSLFGAHTGVVEQLTLPKVSTDVSRREILNWERELIGLYVSDHPLSPVLASLTQAVSHFSGQLSEASSGDHVRVAGLITRVRHHQSKAGKPMGFVTIEDIQGNIELVIFPRTWEKYAETIEHDKIILVDGKVDADGAEPKVLVDTITTEFSMVTPAPLTYSPSGLDPAPLGEMLSSPLPDTDTDSSRVSSSQSATISSLGADAPGPIVARRVRESSPGSSNSEDETDLVPERGIPSEEDTPLPPDAFPDGWFDQASAFVIKHEDANGKRQPGHMSVVTAKNGEAISPVGMTIYKNIPAPGTIAASQVEPDGQTVSPSGSRAASVSGVEIQPAALPPENIGSQGVISSQAIPPVVPPAYLVARNSTSVDDAPVRMITIIFRSTGDKTRDVLRLRRIHGIITSYPGNDRFAFHVFEYGRGYLLEFPNFTAGICTDMLGRITPLVGVDCVRIDPVTFQ